MKVKKAEKELTDKLLREPSKAEVAAQAGITEAKLHSVGKVGGSASGYCSVTGLECSPVCSPCMCILCAWLRVVHHCVSSGQTSVAQAGNKRIAGRFCVLRMHCDDRHSSSMMGDTAKEWVISSLQLLHVPTREHLCSSIEIPLL